MNSLLLRAGLGLGGLLLAFALGFGYGQHRADQAHKLDAALAAAAERAEFDRQLALANTQASAAQAEARAARDYASSLQEEIAHVRVPLVASCPVRRPAAAVAPFVDSGAGVAASAPGAEPPVAGGGLTQHAVRLWNSALAGQPVPAGACGADDPESPACAAGSGLSAEDAWRNHAENAARCAEDRAQLDHLTDYLRQARARP